MGRSRRSRRSHEGIYIIERLMEIATKRKSWTRAHRVLLSSRGVERLASEVILNALSHFFQYHSQPGRQLRAVIAQMREDGQGQWTEAARKRYGIPVKLWKNHRLRAIVKDADPIEFLTSDSAYHQIAQIDGEVIGEILADPTRRLDVARILKRKPSPPQDTERAIAGYTELA